MKDFILRGGFGPFKAMRAVCLTDRRRPLKWALNEYVAYGRAFLRSIFEEGFVKRRTPPNLSRRFENLACGSRSSKWSGRVNRIISKWSTNSWAAELRRNAAKRIMFQGATTVPLFSLVGFTLAKEPSLLSEKDRLEMACQEIREAFKIVHKTDQLGSSSHWPEEMSLSQLQLGTILAKGCNAVVYSADTKPTDHLLGSNSGQNIGQVVDGQFGVMPFRLAVKLMFNYDAESNASSIWRAMHRESVPARLKYLPALFDTRWSPSEFSLPMHPNIVQMHCAFADLFPSLPGGIDLYPDALPARLNRDGFGRNMTLVLVMKRYDCSLKEYLQHCANLPARTSLLLFAQLLEGLVHLYRHQVSHRDLKADNLLLDLTQDRSAPNLVITDFGCCLADHRLGFNLPFTSEDVFRGGNIALMPPEVSTAIPGLFSSIDYSKADLWVAGTLAYEMFGGKNPFYSSTGNSFHLDSLSYESPHDIPVFPHGAHPLIKKIVQDILCRNPKKRLGVETVATCCQLLLHAPPDWMEKKPQPQEVVCWLAEAALHCLGNKQILGVEQMLLETLLSRVTLDGLLAALDYMLSK